MFRNTKREMNIAPLMFVVDMSSLVRTTGKQIDWDLVPASYRRNAFAITVSGAGAAADAVSIPLATPLQEKLVKGQLLDFGTGKELARVTADVPAGVSAIPVSPLGEALEAGDVAYTGSYSSEKVIPQGTVMAELANGKVIPRDAVTGAETAVGILETKASTDTPSDSLTGYSVVMGGIFWENLLTGAVGTPKVLPAGYVTELRARGGQWIFRQWRDSRGA